ncbi:MAG TPA: hypothetical protein VK025_09295 [Steroidobacter sp.]|nr:hypothetical protein [Steroidobacter sp.]
MSVRLVASLLAALIAGCSVAQFYEGERRAPDEVARISGDPRITAGKPVTVILRRVDGRTLRANQYAVEVLPGAHELLVDCRIAETQSVSRHSLQVDVSAGRRYRLIADASLGLRGCADVRLEAQE